MITVQSTLRIVHCLTGRDLKDINATSKQISAIGHFYYCLNISFLMAKKSAKVKSQTDINVHIYRWAISARERRIFPPSVKNELEWLISVSQKNMYNGRLDLVASNILRHLDI